MHKGNKFRQSTDAKKRRHAKNGGDNFERQTSPKKSAKTAAEISLSRCQERRAWCEEQRTQLKFKKKKEKKKEYDCYSFR